MLSIIQILAKSRAMVLTHLSTMVHVQIIAKGRINYFNSNFVFKTVIHNYFFIHHLISEIVKVQLVIAFNNLSLEMKILISDLNNCKILLNLICRIFIRQSSAEMSTRIIKK